MRLLPSTLILMAQLTKADRYLFVFVTRSLYPPNRFVAYDARKGLEVLKSNQTGLYFVQVAIHTQRNESFGTI